MFGNALDLSLVLFASSGKRRWSYYLERSVSVQNSSLSNPRGHVFLERS